MAIESDKQKAEEMLADLVGDPNFMSAGRRNDDAVNLCIALHIIGHDPLDWFERYAQSIGMEIGLMLKALEHIARVVPYLSKWGPKGDEGRALDYKID